MNVFTTSYPSLLAFSLTVAVSVYVTTKTIKHNTIVPASMTQENTTYHNQPGTSSATRGMVVDGQGKDEVEMAETICIKKETIALSPISEHSMVSQDIEKETVNNEEIKNNNQLSDDDVEERNMKSRRK